MSKELSEEERAIIVWEALKGKSIRSKEEAIEAYRVGSMVVVAASYERGRNEGSLESEQIVRISELYARMATETFEWDLPLLITIFNRFFAVR